MTSFHRLREQGKLPPTVTIFWCGDPTLQVGDAFGLEAAWVMDQCMRQQAEQDEAIAEADGLDRLMCDCCQEYQPQHTDLKPSGDELLCDGCAPELDES